MQRDPAMPLLIGLKGTRYEQVFAGRKVHPLSCIPEVISIISWVGLHYHKTQCMYVHTMHMYIYIYTSTAENIRCMNTYNIYIEMYIHTQIHTFIQLYMFKSVFIRIAAGRPWLQPAAQVALPRSPGEGLASAGGAGAWHQEEGGATEQQRNIRILIKCIVYGRVQQ